MCSAHRPVPLLLRGMGLERRGLAPQVSTAEDNGILLYNGDNDHIAVELYQGHVRVSYDPGSYPSSAIYRWGFLRPGGRSGAGRRGGSPGPRASHS